MFKNKDHLSMENRIKELEDCLGRIYNRCLSKSYFSIQDDVERTLPIEFVITEVKSDEQKIDMAIGALRPFVEQYRRYGKHTIFSHGIFINAQQTLMELEGK